MREIKFRVWDNVKKHMYYPFFTSNDREYYISMTGELSVYDEYYNFRGASDKEIPQFFVGRKDKNNKKIYEGDVLEGMGVVVYIPEEARFGISVAGELNEVQFYELEQHEMEVIGNEFETPNFVDLPIRNKHE